MRKIKVFTGNGDDVEEKIQKWIKEKAPNIIEHTSGVLRPSTWSQLYITVLYEETSK